MEEHRLHKQIFNSSTKFLPQGWQYEGIVASSYQTVLSQDLISPDTVQLLKQHKNNTMLKPVNFLQLDARRRMSLTLTAAIVYSINTLRNFIYETSFE